MKIFLTAALISTLIIGCTSTKAPGHASNSLNLRDYQKSLIKRAVIAEHGSYREIIFVTYKAEAANGSILVCGLFGERPPPGQDVAPRMIYQFIGGLSEARFSVLKISSISSSYGAVSDCREIGLAPTSSDAQPL